MDYSSIKTGIVAAIDQTYIGTSTDYKIKARQELEEMLRQVKRLEVAENQNTVKAVRDSEEMYSKILGFLANDQKANAIKLWREFSDDGLKESKDFIDRIDAAGRVGNRHHPKPKVTDTKNADFYAGLIEAMWRGKQQAKDYLLNKTAMSYSDCDRFLAEFNMKANFPFFYNS